MRISDHLERCIQLSNNNDSYLQEPAVSDIATAAARSQIIETWYVTHHSWLRTWLRRRLDIDGQAADLAQDTFVRLLAGRGGDVGAVREPRSFLATVANRVLIDHLRRKTLEKAYLTALAQLPEPTAMSPETRELLFETLCEIDAMLDGLGTRVRQAFLWSQLEGMGYAEIASRQGVSVSSVKKYVARAVERCVLYRLEH